MARPITITANETTQVDTAQSKFGGASALFDGNQDYLSIAHNGDILLGTGNFTIEMWVRPNAKLQKHPMLMSNANGWASNVFQFHDRHDASNTKFTLWVNNYSNSVPMLTSTTSVSNGTWYHLAIVRNGTSWKFYVNGTEEASQTSSVSLDGSAGSTYYVGAIPNSDHSYNGWIDEIRISNTARYTTNFTPATVAFTSDANTLLLIHADGSDASTTFTDDTSTAGIESGSAALTSQFTISAIPGDLDPLYIDVGYIDAGYYEGVIYEEANADISASFNLSTIVGIIKENSSTMVTSFTIQATISHIEGADLYAFTEAAIAVTIDVIRSTNVSLSTQFDVATDAIRLRNISSQEDAFFTFSGFGERSRAFDMETQAAFSITADGDVIGAALEGAASLTATTSLTVPGERTQTAASILESTVDVNAQAERFAEFASTADAVADLSVIISHIHGADIVANGFASLTTVVDVVRELTVSLDTAVDTTVVADRIYTVNISLDSNSNVSTIAETTKEFAIALTLESNTSIIADKFSDESIIINSSTEQTTDGSRIRYADSSQQSTADVFCVISHIHGADIIASGFASLTVESTVTYSPQVQLSTIASISTTAVKNVIISSSIVSLTSLSLISRIQLRPTTVFFETDNVYTPLVIVPQGKFGGALQQQSGPELYPDYNIIWDGDSFKAFDYYNSGNGYQRVYSSNDGISWTYQNSYYNYDASPWQTQFANGIYNGQNFRFYFNWIRQSTNTGQPTIHLSYDGGINWVGFNDYSRIYNLRNVLFGSYISFGQTFINLTYLTGTTEGNYSLSSYIYRIDSITGSNTRVGSGHSSSSLNSDSLKNSFTDSTGSLFLYTKGITTIIARASGIGASADVSPYTLFNTSSYYGISADYGSGKYAVLRSDGKISSSSSWNTGWTSSTATYANPKSIKFVNNKWVVTTTSGSIYTGTDFNNLALSPNVTIYDSSSLISYGNGKYVVSDKPGYAKVSTDLINWTNETIDGSQHVANELTYTSNVNYSEAKSIDFWLNVAGSGDTNSYIFNFNLASGWFYCYMYTKGRMAVDYSNGTLMLTPFSLNQWNHFRIVKNNNIASLYVNGTRVSTQSDWGSALPSSNSITIAKNSRGDNDYVNFDEILITKSVLNDPSDTTITVPTKSWTNDSNTLLLLHFNTDFSDDSRYSPVERASLQSISSVSSKITVDYELTQQLNSEFTVACAAQRSKEIILTAFTDAALTANIDKIKEAQATADADTSLSIIAEKAVEVFAQLEITTTQTSTEDRLRDNQITTDAVFSEMAVVARVADFFVNCDVTSTVTCNPIKTVAIDSLITSSSSMSITADKYVGFVVSANSEVILTAESYKIKQFSSDLAANCGVILTGEKISDFIASISATFALEATSTGTIDFIALIASAGTLTANVERLRDGISLEAGEFTLTANTFDSLAKQGSAALDSNFTQQTDNLRVRYADAAFEAFYSELAVVEYTADVVCNITVETALSAIPRVFKDVNVTFESTATFTSSADRTRDNESSQSSEFTIVAIGRTSLDVAADLFAESSLTALVNKTTDISIIATDFADMSTNVEVIRGYESSLSSTFQSTVDGSRIRFESITTNSQSTLTATVGYKTNAYASLQAQFAINVSNTSVLHIDEYVWKIPAESRYYKISTETRSKNIFEESRIYTIRR